MTDFMVDMELRRQTGLCSSRGPRIGCEDATPRCRLPIGHDGVHRPAAEDGWGTSMSWSDAAWQ